MSTRPKKTHPTQRVHVGVRVKIAPRGRRGIYTAEYWYHGQHRRKSLGTPNKRVARQRAAELDHQLTTGTFAAPAPSAPKTTVADAVNAFIDYSKVEGLRPKSISRYSGELNALAKFLQEINVEYLSEIALSHVDRFRAARSKMCKPKTLYHEATVFKQFIAWCKTRDLLAANPLQDWRPAKPARTIMPVPTLEEMTRIIENCTLINRQRLTILAMTGMRIGELQGLTKSNVDLRRGVIAVVGQIDGPTKSKRVREIPIHPRLKPLLAKLVAADDHTLLVTASPSPKYPNGGHRICDKKLNAVMKQATKLVTKKHYTLHSCRRFFNTHIVNQRVPERIVRAWMGHHDRSMTGVYYGLDPDESCRFMAQVDFGELGLD